jgi:uncharacterized protein YkwD
MPRTPLEAVAFLLGFWLALALLQPIAAEASSPADPGLARLEAELHVEVNAVRGQHHLVALRRAPELDAIARAHSADMAVRRYLAHDTPEGLSPVDRIARGGVSGFTLAAENAGLTSGSAPNREIVQGWLRSPLHRENLLAPAFNTTGIGIARAADGTLYYTQLYVTFPRAR